MRISKVNFNPSTGKTLVAYETVENEGKDSIEHVLHSDDAPHPDLLQSLAALKPEVEGLCELPAGYLTDVRGVSIHRTESDDGSETVTVTYTATKKIGESRSPLVVNTPAVLLEGDGVKALLKEACKFAEGRRAQEDLFTKEKPPAKVEQPKMAKGKADTTAPVV